MRATADKPAWQEWLVGIVGALVVSAVVSGIGLYAASEVSKAQLKSVSESVDKLALKVEKISGQVAGTEQAVGIRRDRGARRAPYNGAGPPHRTICGTSCRSHGV